MSLGVGLIFLLCCGVMFGLGYWLGKTLNAPVESLVDDYEDDYTEDDLIAPDPGIPHDVILQDAG